MRDQFAATNERDFGRAMSLDATHRGRGRISGVEVRGRTGYLYRLRDGQIFRAELYPGPAEALEAAVLPG